MAKGYHLRELRLDVKRESPLLCLYYASNGASQAPDELRLSKVTDLVREFADMGGETLAIPRCEPLVYKNLPLIPSVCRTLGILITAMIFLNSSEQRC